MSQRVRVNPIACDAHGLCVELLPELIRLDDWGYPIIDDSRVPPELLGLAKMAGGRVSDAGAGAREGVRLLSLRPVGTETQDAQLPEPATRAGGPSSSGASTLGSTSCSCHQPTSCQEPNFQATRL